MAVPTQAVTVAPHVGRFGHAANSQTKYGHDEHRNERKSVTSRVHRKVPSLQSGVSCFSSVLG